MNWPFFAWIIGALLVGSAARWLMTPSRHRPFTATLIGALWPVWLLLVVVFLLLDLIEVLLPRRIKWWRRM